jgi:hypothetical protein
MIAQTSDLPAEPTYTLETVNASRLGMPTTASIAVLSFGVATLMADEDDEELVRPAAMVQRVLDHLDEPIRG